MELAEVRKKIAKYQGCISCGGSNQFVGLKTDGTVVSVGQIDRAYQHAISRWRNIVAISSGSGNIVGLKYDGSVVQIGGTYIHSWEWSDIVAISAGDARPNNYAFLNVLGLKSDGTVVKVHRTENSRVAEAIEKNRNWRDIVAVSAVGEYKKMVLKSDGTVIGEGGTENWRDIVAISAGENFSIGLKADGTVAVVSNDGWGFETESWCDIVAVTAGSTHIGGLKADGTVVAVALYCTADNRPDYPQCNTESWKDIVAVSAGFHHTVGLKADGTLVAVGDNDYGLCDEIESLRNIGPVPEETLLKWKQGKGIGLSGEEEAEEARRIEQSKKWASQGLCRYCGGKLGLFGKCKSCGKK